MGTDNKRMSGKHSIIEGILKGRFSILLFSIALMFLVVPLVPAEKSMFDRAIGIFGLVVLISCLRAITPNRKFFIFMLILSLINVGIGGMELISTSESDTFLTVVMGFRLLYYLFVFGSIMGYVLDNSAVTADKIAGSISAYILLGIIWAVIFSLFLHLKPGSFVLPEHLESGSIMGVWSIYFSFTTLTTLGYGDITPQLPAVQSYAVMEAACGQIFLAVIIARLIALQIVHSGMRK
jgi:voltage-gated potassium channel